MMGWPHTKRLLTGSLTPADGRSGTYTLLTEGVVKLLIVERASHVCVWSRTSGRVQRLHTAGCTHLFTPTDHTHTPVSYTHLTLPTIYSV